MVGCKRAEQVLSIVVCNSLRIEMINGDLTSSDLSATKSDPAIYKCPEQSEAQSASSEMPKYSKRLTLKLHYRCRMAGFSLL